MSLTPSERTLRASIAAHTMWANTDDWSARTKPGRDAFRRSFDKQVDPKGVLAPAERSKRGEALYQAHFKKMALAKSKKARGTAG